ncbi:hypothetical protein, partial [Pseudoalteromonas sp. SYSU M81241]
PVGTEMSMVAYMKNSSPATGIPVVNMIEAPHEEVLNEILAEREKQKELGISSNVIQHGHAVSTRDSVKLKSQ